MSAQPLNARPGGFGLLLRLRFCRTQADTLRSRGETCADLKCNSRSRDDLSYKIKVLARSPLKKRTLIYNKMKYEKQRNAARISPTAAPPARIANTAAIPPSSWMPPPSRRHCKRSARSIRSSLRTKPRRAPRFLFVCSPAAPRPRSPCRSLRAGTEPSDRRGEPRQSSGARSSSRGPWHFLRSASPRGCCSARWPRTRNRVRRNPPAPAAAAAAPTAAPAARRARVAQIGRAPRRRCRLQHRLQPQPMPPNSARSARRSPRGGVTAAAQQPFVLQLQNGGSVLATRPAGLLVLNCSTNMTCSFSGSTFTLTASGGGGGSGCIPPGSTANALLYDAGSGNCADAAKFTFAFSTLTGAGGASVDFTAIAQGSKRARRRRRHRFRQRRSRAGQQHRLLARLT